VFLDVDEELLLIVVHKHGELHPSAVCEQSLDLPIVWLGFLDRKAALWLHDP
jgi:hypothetical protein